MAAEGLNLVTAIFNLTNSSGAIAGYTKDLLRWLSRQGIDERAFERCAKLARGLAYPNQNGSLINRSVTAADAKIPLLDRTSIKLWYSGSLGRMMLNDSDYSYMVSTVASLITHHNLEFAKLTLVSMMLDKGGHEDECKPQYQVQRAPVMAVVSKIVESIYLNVTNLGHRVAPLPEVLAALHPHLLDDTTFAALVTAVRQNPNNLLLRSTRFPADIIQWLYNHFEGSLLVYLGNERIFAEKLGTSDRVIRCMIEERCSIDTITCDRRDWPIQLLTMYDSLPVKPLVTGSTDGEVKIDPAIRTRFYALRTHFGKDDENNIISVAQRMLSWLLEQKIEKGIASDIAVEPVGFVFSCPDEAPVSPFATHQLCVADLLATTPTLLNKDTGKRMGTAPVFRKPSWDAGAEEVASNDSDFDFTGEQQSVEDLLRYFPSAEDLLATMTEKCSCRACQGEWPLDRCKAGCKRYEAIAAVCTLLCHAIAEGFDSRDAADHLSSSTALSGVFAVFAEIIFEQVLRWDTWFKVVALVVQGCDWLTATDGTHEEGGTCWVATQYGSLVVIAAWLESTWQFDLSGCFKVSVLEGSIPEIDEIASIVSEQTAATQPTQPVSSSAKSLKSYLREEFVMFRAESECFRRMSIMTVDQSIRVVDISAKMNHLSRSKTPSCKHRSASDLDELHYQHDVKIFQLPDILRFWGRETYQDTEICASEILENAHEVSSVLALAYGGAVLWNLANCCWQCAYSSARQDSLRYVVSFLFTTKRLQLKSARSRSPPDLK